MLRCLPALLVVLAGSTLCPRAAAHDVSVGGHLISARFLPAQLPPARQGAQGTVAVIVRCEPMEDAGAAPSVTVSLRAPDGVSVLPNEHKVRLKPNADAPVFFQLQYTSPNPGELRVAALIGSQEAAVLESGGCYDLSAVEWKSRLDKDGVGEFEGWASPDFDDSDWAVRHLPSMWNDVGVMYLRARLFVPEAWRGKGVFLRLKAVDDNDVCCLNGVEIGRTGGWDVQRNYRISPDAIEYGAENLICIAVDNVFAGGGIYRTPSYFGVDLPDESRGPKPKLAAPGPVGKPLPFRRMLVSDGVLLYEDGGEVALWGVNCYPQSWHQYDNMKRLGVDMKKAIRDDLDDMKRMGVEVIRIHVFDREISDAEGSLLDNEHLDLLDYLISEASKRGIYFFFTPIAWWWGPDQNPDSFSAHTPKEYMFCDDGAIRAQVNYLKNWLNHVNRYTERPYKDEPAICVLEIMNEPGYVDYNMMAEPDAQYYPGDPPLYPPFKKRLRGKWLKWCAANGLADEPRFFPLFRYELLSRYLDTIHRAIRSTGARQPVACALFDTTGQDDLVAAIADSPCEAVTTGLYAGAWDKVGDGTNYLPYTANQALDPRLDEKARLVYEFDGIKTFGSYFYPACARRFRNLGVQICCMFQYDSSATAEWNTDWDAHYLNWLYTPNKAVSFYIGGRAFRDLPRGASFPTDGTTQTFGRCVVSFDRNISVYADDSSYLQSAPFKDWRPLPVPKKPGLVMAVGDSPFAEYAGTGAYTLETDYAKRTAELTINPDADVVGDPWHPNIEKSAVVLKDAAHPFKLKLPGVRLAGVTKSGQPVEVKDNTFKVSTGTYLLRW